MAESLGKRLLGEVEEVGLDECLHSLRHLDARSSHDFGLPPLDRLINIVNNAKPASLRRNEGPPVVEIMSLAPNAGKTHLVYHMTAIAVLPRAFAGREACCAVVDTDGSFSVSRLATQLKALVSRSQPDSSTPLDEDGMMYSIIETALRHVHAFRPQSLSSTIATLESLPGYLFKETRHYSYNREMAFITIDSVTAFYWQDRAETEDVAFLNSTADADNKSLPLQSGYTKLAPTLRATCKTFDCPALLTTCYFGSAAPPALSPASKAFRSSFPAPMANLPTLRLIIQRMPVRKFPAGMTLEQALREGPDRQKAVEEGKIEVLVNDWNMDERTLQRLGNAGFTFRIRNDGVHFEQ